MRNKFTGYERDDETGLDYAQARYYGSTMGRFTSVDSYNPVLEAENEESFRSYLGQAQNWNRYAYSWNNPLRYIDPDGRKVNPEDAKALEYIKQTLPAELRDKIVLDKSGLISQDAINAIESTDANFLDLKALVNASDIMEVATATGWADNKGNAETFNYQTPDEQVQEMISKGLSPAVANQLRPTLLLTNYLGQTIAPADSPTGNLRVVISDGTGGAADAPMVELAVTSAHEIYGHGLRYMQGRAWEHDKGGPVSTHLKQIESRTYRTVLGPTTPTRCCVRNPN